MKIGIDIQTTLGQRSGFGYYVSNLVKHLEQQKQHELSLFAPHVEQDFSAPQRLWWDQVTVPKLARRARVDILHQPAFSAPVFYRGQVIVTVHDTISILFGKNIPRFSRLYFGRWMPFTYRFADHIIAVSEHTKKDIVRILRIPAEKITVIYEAAGEEFHARIGRSRVAAVKRKFSLHNPYFLHVGTLEPRKNLEFLIESFSALVKTLDERVDLVIAGKKGWYYENLFNAAHRYGLQGRVHFIGYVDDRDKPALYKGARAFLFPSLYEGFGLPPLEAMASGIPVIASNTSSIPEIVGEAGILLAPTHKDAWVKAMTRLASNEGLRTSFSRAGALRARYFSWDRCAKETIRVYEKAARA